MAISQISGRQSILDQARQLFLTRGYHGVSVRDIVHACGLSNAALYHHFGSKDHLFVEVLTTHLAEITQRLREAGSAAGSCRERLTRMTEAFAQIMLESQSELQTLYRDLMICNPDEGQRLLTDAQWQVPSLFAAVLEEGVAAGEVRTPLDSQRVSIMLTGMVFSLALHRQMAADDDAPADDIELIMDTLFRGISNR